MARQTIDLGIDLGTTNSSMAVAQGQTAEVIRNRFGDDITASAVWCDTPTSLVVGNSAYDAAARDPQNVALRFKRFMGEDRPHAFSRNGQSLSPEELSAKVISTLLDGAEDRFGERPGAAVITVPSDFELHQCQATERAARLAGLETCLLLQEPVAAAQAYGYHDETKQAYWLIYDIGAGTFDVALLRIDGGVLRIVGQRGDSYLGGLRIDEEIVRRYLAPYLSREHRLEFEDLPETARWQLRMAAEKAKKQLSNPEYRSAQILDTFRVDRKRFVQIDYALSRGELDAILTPLVLRSVRICRDLLDEHHLAAEQVAKVILVGGPTHSSTLRGILADPADGLGLALDTRLDPMTVVSCGAAIWASSQPLPTATRVFPVAAGTHTVSFPAWLTVGDEDDLEVHGRVETAGGEPTAGYTVEFANENSAIGWRSGRFTVAEGGGFRAVLHAEKGVQNAYRVELRDRAGALCPSITVPAALTHNRGRLIEGSQLTHSIGAGLADDSMIWVARKNQVLPVCAKVSLSTAWQVLRERTGDRIIIPLMEGESERASRNHEVGAVVIPAGDLPRDLAAHSEVWLEVHLDESRLVNASVYIPAIDRTFERVIDLRGIRPPHPADVERRAEAAVQRLDAVSKEMEDNPDAGNRGLERIQSDNLRAELEESLPSVESSADAARLVEARSRELQARLDEAEEELAPARAVNAMTWAHNVVGEYGNEEEQGELDDLDARLNQCLAQDPPPADTMADLQRKATTVAFQALDRADILPVWYFEYLEKQIYAPPSRGEALRLINQGKQAMRNHDVAELRGINGALVRLLPVEPSLASTVIRRLQH